MKFNKNEFGWKEKVSVNTNELVTKNDIPHYNETLMFEITGDDFSSFYNNNYFNMGALNIDETKTYVGKVKIDINSNEEFIFKFVYNKTNNALICGYGQTYIYNHKLYDGTNLIEDENSAVLTLGITPMSIVLEGEGYFRLYEIDKVKLDTNCLPDNVNIPNSLTVGTRIGDIGEFSVTEGYETIASGGYSHAEGSITKATELYSHAEGNYSEASGNASHAEGHETIASGEYSHAEGYKCKSESNSSHAEGCLTEANNFYTHAEGFYTIAKGYSQHVQGKCNIEDTTGKYAHIVGNGESETERSNAHTLDWKGNGWYQGELYTGGTSQSDANKVLTTANISFNESGELVVTINGVSKIFVPKE